MFHGCINDNNDVIEYYSAATVVKNSHKSCLSYAPDPFPYLQDIFKFKNFTGFKMHVILYNLLRLWFPGAIKTLRCFQFYQRFI